MNDIKETCLIQVSLFDTCLIDKMTREQILELYEGRKNGAYYLDKFQNYLKTNHNISLKDYCKQYLKIDWPKCPISNEEVGYKICGKGIKLSTFKLGRISRKLCPAFDAACDKMSAARKGSNNPMYGRASWNKGLGIENPIIAKIAENRRGTKASEETRQKQKDARARSPLKARHTQKHSLEVREKMKLHTAKLWATGVFNRVSSIHLKMRDYLKTLPLKYRLEEEWQVKYFSMDFAFPEVKIAIECQGTYFHVDPRIYPLGPIDAIQRRNYGRDIAKEKVCGKEGWLILEVWETEINDGSFKEKLKCKLSELNILNESDSGIPLT